LMHTNKNDYISLTDIARQFNQEGANDLVAFWLSERMTVEFLGLWEKENNPEFDTCAFDEIKLEAGRNGYIITPKKWVDSTKAIGFDVRGKQYFAHQDISLQFACWLSPLFKLYMIKTLNSGSNSAELVKALGKIG